MAELRLTDEQQRQLTSLLGRLGEDAAFRTRLESEPQSVFAEYGLSALLPEGEGLEDIRVTVEQPEVAGYLLHADYHSDAHTDSHEDGHANSHGDAPIFRGGRLGSGLPSISIGRLL